MLRTTLVLALSALSTTAFAHPGHLANVVHGHNHADIFAAVVAVAVATYVARKQYFS